MTPHRPLLPLVAITLCGASGCVSLDSPMAQKQLQIISAGHTGCMPDDNAISNVISHGASATWNATCKGKTYLCSAVSSGSNSSSFSCAAAAQ